MPNRMPRRRGAMSLAPAGLALALAPAVQAGGGIDLQIDRVEFSQAIQTEEPSLVQVKDRPTMVRVYVNWNKVAYPIVPNVSATLIVNGTTYHQMNDDPMTLDGSDGPLAFNRSINFWIRVSDDFAHCTLQLDPANLIDETSEGNNTLVWDQPFVCREERTIAYTRVNYLDEGKPDSGKVGPGSGELFIRAIYPMPDVTYIAWPSIRVKRTVDDPSLGTDADSSLLIAEMSVARVVRNALSVASGSLPAQHYYAWFPGDLNGNGLAPGPGHVGLGNSESNRYKRTIAHELGHNFDMGHAYQQLGWYGTDVRRLLDRSIIQDQFLKGVMWPAQPTSDAFVSIEEYSHLLFHPWLLCSGSDEPPEAINIIKDIVGHLEGGTAVFDAVFEHQGSELSNDQIGGSLIIQTLDGNEVIDSALQNPSVLVDDSGAGLDQFNVSLRAAVGPLVADRIRVLDAASGAVLGERVASPNPPAASILNLQNGGVVTDGMELQVVANDQDGDSLRHLLFWTADGASWVPILSFLPKDIIYFLVDTNEMAGAPGGTGRFRLLTSDGFHTSVTEITNLTLPAQHAPTVAILWPRQDDTWRTGVGCFLSAAAVDLEDAGSLDGASVQWTSSIDGKLGVGRELFVESLSPGIHQLCVEATDSDGMTTMACTSLEVAGGTPPNCCVGGVRIDEIRVAHPGGPPQLNEYFELGGVPGLPLDCLHYIVVGPGGVVDDVVSLATHHLGPTGRFLCGQTGPLPFWGVMPDMVDDLNFLDAGDRTHLLVCSCSGIVLPPGGDLDTNNDGTLDIVPWECVLDCVRLMDAPPNLPTMECGPTVGPQTNGALPPHVFRCVPNGTWRIGQAPLPGAPDTPGAENPPCFPPGDLDGDGEVAGSDLALLLGSWGAPGGDADLDGDGTVGASDLAVLLGAWTGG